MTYTLDTPLYEALEASEKAGGFKPSFNVLRSVVWPGATLGDLVYHPDGPFWAYIFARDVVRGRFEAGEFVISKEAMPSRRYSKIPGVPNDWRAQV